MPVVIAIDAGTTGVRSFAVREDGSPAGYAYREFPQHFPRPGWVEHDPRHIWDATTATLAELVARLDGETVAAVGITNQRETVVAWGGGPGGAPPHPPASPGRPPPPPAAQPRGGRPPPPGRGPPRP